MAKILELLKHWPSQSLFAIVLMLSSLLASGEAFELSDFEVQLRDKAKSCLAQIQPEDLNVTYNGLYYEFGSHGLEHERVVAARYAEWLGVNTGKKFLFVPGFGGVDTPGVDGTIFTEDFIRPEARVSLKTLSRLGNIPSLRVKKIIDAATISSIKHSTLEGTFSTVFPRFREENPNEWLSKPPKSFFKKIKLLAAAGLKNVNSVPTIVVLQIDDQLASQTIESLAVELKERMLTSEKPRPEEIVLMTKDRVVHLKIASNYSSLICDTVLLK